MKVIAGTGRCGTRWLARTLRRSGIAAGHEAAHQPDQIVDLNIAVDVSWLAVVHGTPIDLLVAREPAGCIGSLIDCGLFTDGDRYTRAVASVIDLTGDPFTDACTWWTYVNTRPARARWRLGQPDRLPAALAEAGIPVGPIRPADRDRHPIGARTTDVQWSDLPADVKAVAAGWGWGG